MGYHFTAQWLKGTMNEAADALSRHPHQKPTDGDDLAEQDMDTHHSQAAPYQGLSIAQMRASTLLPSQQENLHLQELRRHTEKDQTYQSLKLLIVKGFPNTKVSLTESLRKF
jgi:hypothetical protein